MKKTLFFFIAVILYATSAGAQNWDEIISSDDYYYGEGFSDTYDKAKSMALSALTGMIATHVSNDFTYLIDETNTNGEIEHESRVLNCLKTYSQATLNNVKEWVVSEPPQCKVRCYIKCSELDRVFDNRIAKAKSYYRMAGVYLSQRKIGVALQFYYWAYSLIRSVQRPAEVKDDDGNLLVVTIPSIIEDIADNVNVTFDRRSDDYVDFLFTYEGKPVASIDFTYNNGQDLCYGKAKDGHGTVQVKSTHSGEVYHMNIEYEYKDNAAGDVELESVLNVVPRKVFSTVGKTILGRKTVNEPAVMAENVSATVASADVASADAVGAGTAEADSANVVAKSAEERNAEIVNAQHLNPQTSQLFVQNDIHKTTMNKVLEAISARRYSDVANFDYFTPDGLEVFNSLVTYGTGRVVGVPDIQFYNGLDSCLVARGLQMSFSFNRGRKQTFVEDVIFYFDREGKIDNVSFGLGFDATNTILDRGATSWGGEVREILLEFLENYKTAYALERLEYIESIFSENAQIIVGKVLKSKTNTNAYAERGQNVSVEGQKAIEYTRHTKKSFMEHLKRIFANNEFINLNFSDVSVRKITKITDRNKFVIQLAQDYCSSSYSDKGYLLLLVDITNSAEPLIEIRTWQPDEVDFDKVFHEGMFYSN